MDLEQFVNQYIEGYLFKDLENMSLIKLKQGEQYGAAGYPMVATVLAGIELLGGLLTNDIEDFDSHDNNKGKKYFNYYWDNFLTKESGKYMGLGDLFRGLIRNGITHVFMSKPGIFITKEGDPQIRINIKDRLIIVDCNSFYKDFKNSYFNNVKQILSKEDATSISIKNRMQTRLNQMIKQYTEDTERVFSLLESAISANQKLKKYFDSVFIQSKTSGASGLSYPMSVSYSGFVSTTTTNNPTVSGIHHTTYTP